MAIRIRETDNLSTYVKQVQDPKDVANILNNYLKSSDMGSASIVYDSLGIVIDDVYKMAEKCEEGVKKIYFFGYDDQIFMKVAEYGQNIGQNMVEIEFLNRLKVEIDDATITALGSRGSKYIIGIKLPNPNV